MKTLKRKRGTAATEGMETSEGVVAPVLVLASSCTVKDAAELKVRLCSHLDTTGCVLLDAGNVERIDTATLQLLCAFVRDRQARGYQVQWSASSAAVHEAADLLDLRSLLCLQHGSNNMTGAVP